eukprot:TRINITY_DN85901_c0_g1_i1.p1 TRINITY_DN85901_c0_g1~~TRINITY_DN85901_c0_g1_i1.p1  ORF type:complete len:172 (-),score=24.65 TRINITY_DN85901_c0_g1_i1:6-521(-)
MADARGGSGVNSVANYASVLDDNLRGAFHTSRSSNTPSLPTVIAGGIGCLFGATILGAISYRRSAKRLAKMLPPVQPRPTVVQADAPPLDIPPRPTEVLTKGEIVRLFVVPGIFAALLAGALGGFCRLALDVDSVEDVARQLRWLVAGGPRPARVGAARPEAATARNSDAE